MWVLLTAEIGRCRFRHCWPPKPGKPDLGAPCPPAPGLSMVSGHASLW